MKLKSDAIMWNHGDFFSKNTPFSKNTQKMLKKDPFSDEIPNDDTYPTFQTMTLLGCECGWMVLYATHFKVCILYHTVDIYSGTKGLPKTSYIFFNVTVLYSQNMKWIKGQKRL